jgi:hypothetical protein
MAFHIRKSAALAIDGQPAIRPSLEHVAALDIDDINIWLQNYLRAHAQPNRVLRKTMSIDQLGLDCAARSTLLDAFEYRYSIVLDAPETDCFASVSTLAQFLLAQVHAGHKETTAYVGARYIMHTMTSNP